MKLAIIGSVVFASAAWGIGMGHYFASNEPSTWAKRSECLQMADRIHGEPGGYDRAHTYPHYNAELDKCFVQTSLNRDFSHHPWLELSLWDGQDKMRLAEVYMYTEDRVEDGYIDGKHVGCIAVAAFVAEKMQDSPGVHRSETLCHREGRPSDNQ